MLALMVATVEAAPPQPSTPVQPGEAGHSATLTAAINNPLRSDAQRARDLARHPQQTLEFFGISPQMTVIEIWPGAGWYTDILAPYLAGQGQYIAAHFPASSTIDYFARNRAAFDAKLKASDGYAQVNVVDFAPPQSTKLAPPASVDAVLTFRNIHNWMKAGSDAEAFAAFYAALKPGGVLGVVEHRLPPAREQDPKAASGYVHEAVVIAMAEKAGFKLVARSEINANPKDNADHPQGVWTLPPTLALGDERRDYYLAIGESDRMTLKFIKP
ncbi:MAG: class I SAM-dependent methyltransferase [Gammaproteobacteria bacterium]|nr:class I SAM-dependent methyltransferase [Gammaproteobacteria bacterium]